eukprot:PhF_6_TR8014/c0_g1_i3/m.12425
MHPQAPCFGAGGCGYTNSAQCKIASERTCNISKPMWDLAVHKGCSLGVYFNTSNCNNIFSGDNYGGLWVHMGGNFDGGHACGAVQLAHNGIDYPFGCARGSAYNVAGTV